MEVPVNFILDVDLDSWLGGAAGRSVDKDRVVAEVQRHAEGVVRNLYEDQGWSAPVLQQVPECNYGTPFCFNSFDHTVCSVDVQDQDEAERIINTR